MYRRDLRDTDRDRLLADMAVTDQVVQVVPEPGGERVAYACAREDRVDLWLATGGEHRRLTSEGVFAMRYGRTDSRWFDWSPCGSDLAYASAAGDLWRIDTETGEKTRLTHHEASDAQARWAPDGARLAFVTDYWSPAGLGIVAADGSRLACPYDDEYHYTDPRWGDDALYAVRSRHRDLFDDESEIVRITPGGDCRVVFAEPGVRAYGARPRPGSETRSESDGRGERGSEEVAFVHDATGFDALYIVEADGGAAESNGSGTVNEPEEVFALDGTEIGAPAWDESGERLAVTATREGNVAVHVVERSGESHEIVTEPGRRYAPAWRGEEVCCVETTPKRPARVREITTERTLAGSVPIGFDERLRAPETITYDARDGRAVHAMVYLPDGFDEREAESVPLLVHPHGGPTAFDGFAFDFRAQYFAALGYVVIEPNYRGSDGFGRAVRNANDRAWGAGDLEEVIDAADAVANRYDAIDGERAGIFGGSGGGLMTVNALGRSDRFLAGAAFYGVYDYESFVDDTDDVGWQLMKRELGDLATERANYREESPIRFVPSIDAPLLLVHGEADERVPISQSEQLVAELDRKGKRYEFERYDGEPHGFTRRENVCDAYTRVADLFAKYLRIDPDDGSSRPHPERD